jgi:hypothetical protein
MDDKVNRGGHSWKGSRGRKCGDVYKVLISLPSTKNTSPYHHAMGKKRKKLQLLKTWFQALC